MVNMTKMHATTRISYPFENVDPKLSKTHAVNSTDGSDRTFVCFKLDDHIEVQASAVDFVAWLTKLHIQAVALGLMCTGFEYPIDAPEEGTDIHHDHDCTLHEFRPCEFASAQDECRSSFECGGNCERHGEGPNTIDGMVV